jgi:hypothetical protein
MERQRKDTATEAVAVYQATLASVMYPQWTELYFTILALVDSKQHLKMPVKGWTLEWWNTQLDPRASTWMPYLASVVDMIIEQRDEPV